MSDFFLKMSRLYFYIWKNYTLMGKTILYEKKIGGHGEQLLFTQDLRSKLRSRKALRSRARAKQNPAIS